MLRLPTRWQHLFFIGLVCWLISFLARQTGQPGELLWLALAIFGAVVMTMALMAWRQDRRRPRRDN
jgi:hypothetical protein